MTSPKPEDETSLRAKGKEKEETTEEGSSSSSKHHQGNSPTGSQSMTSRIAASASNLGTSLLRGRPLGDEISQVASPAKERETLRQLETRNGESSSANDIVSPRATGDRFRDRTTSGPAPTQEQEFSSFLSDATRLPSERFDPMSNGLQSPETYASHGATSDPAPWIPPSAIAEQEMRDGSAVIDLLDGPGVEDLDYTQTLINSEDELTGLRSALFGTSSAAEWDHLLNFIPEFIRPDQGGGYADVSHGTRKADETASVLGLPHSAESARVWIEQWQDVLTRYTDEVWGDLRPLVHEAQAEVDKLEKQNASGSSTPTSALLRLRQILQHMRGG